jgi:hypothetical protein
MEKTTLSDGKVKETLRKKGFTFVKLQAEDIAKLKQLPGFNDIIGLPAFVIFEYISVTIFTVDYLPSLATADLKLQGKGALSYVPVLAIVYIIISALIVFKVEPDTFNSISHGRI